LSNFEDVRQGIVETARGSANQNNKYRTRIEVLFVLQTAIDGDEDLKTALFGEVKQVAVFPASKTFFCHGAALVFGEAVLEFSWKALVK
jgi:hypothetical protein